MILTLMDISWKEMSLLFANRSVCELIFHSTVKLMWAWNRSSLGPWGRWVWRREWEQSSVATRLRLPWCLQYARVLQAVHRRSAREGSPGNHIMKDRLGNEREWRWRWEWYSIIMNEVCRKHCCDDPLCLLFRSEELCLLLWADCTLCCFYFFPPSFSCFYMRFCNSLGRFYEC